MTSTERAQAPEQTAAPGARPTTAPEQMAAPVAGTNGAGPAPRTRGRGTASGRAAALATRWAGAYTRRLAPEQAERRRLELASDLWEQRALGRELGAPDLAVALSIIRRMVAGMTADLSWRNRQRSAAPARPPRRGGTRMTAALGRTWWLILGALVAAAEIAIGVGIANEGNPGSIAGGAIIAAGGVAILAGIAWRRRARFAGDVAICAGAVPVLPFFWLYVPFIALVVIVAAALDAADARSLSRGSVPAPAATRRRTVLAVIAAAVLVAGLVLGSPAIALVVVAAAALAAVLVSSRRRSRPTT